MLYNVTMFVTEKELTLSGQGTVVHKYLLQILVIYTILSFGRSCFRFAPLFISSPPYTIDRYSPSPTPYKCGTPTNRRSLTTLDEAVNEHVSAARPESGGK